MLPAQRHRRMVDLINDRGSVRVKELSQVFKVTEETVRRDLDILEEDGKVKRTHGGAVKVLEMREDVPYFERESKNVMEKKAIASEAVKFIRDGDKIALDASTTAWYVALQMPNIPITVLTNSLKVSMELASRSKIEVISTGGIVRTSSLSCVGPMAEETLESFHVNKTFISCKGLHKDYGISESSDLQAMVKRKMIDISDKVFVLADHSKIQVRDFKFVAHLDELDVLITDTSVLPSDLEELKSSFQIELVQV